MSNEEMCESMDRKIAEVARDKVAAEMSAGHCCVDCLCLLANGDTPPEMDETETAAWVAEIDRRTEGFTVVPACPEECEGSFSWSSCDVCGSHLGGDRHPVAFLPLKDTRTANTR